MIVRVRWLPAALVGIPVASFAIGLRFGIVPQIVFGIAAGVTVYVSMGRQLDADRQDGET